MELDRLEGPPIGLTQARAPERAARRAEVDAERQVELLPRAVEVSLPHLRDAEREMGVGPGDELSGRVLTCGRRLRLPRRPAVRAARERQPHGGDDHHPSLIRGQPPEPGQNWPGC